MGSSQQEGEEGQSSKILEYESDIECLMKQDQFEDDIQVSTFEDSTNAYAKDGKAVGIYAEMEFQTIDDAFKSYSDYAHNKDAFLVSCSEGCGEDVVSSDSDVVATRKSAKTSRLDASAITIAKAGCICNHSIFFDS
ncbi:hypothetical protein ACH5RR_009052 [Cinchona calisaya]|uniref:Uncharacterized protein n=1 Tax=Cinchona calisaya TaxID=153742 RepID=A0ABD3AD23_9GENT